MATNIAGSVIGYQGEYTGRHRSNAKPDLLQNTNYFGEHRSDLRYRRKATAVRFGVPDAVVISAPSLAL